MKITDPAGLLPATSFHNTLRLERARADRTGSEFSLVIFEVSRPRVEKAVFERFARQLLRRKRTVDSAGWFDDSWLGVLLPDTDLEGGWRFAVDFESGLRQVDWLPPFTVYAYPRHWSAAELDRDTPPPLPPRDEPPAPRWEDPWALARFRVSSILAGGMPVWKRLMDIGGSLVAIALCLPLWLVLAAYIRIVSPGPVLYRSTRVGRGGRLFTFLKLRTMHVNNDENAHRRHSTHFIHADVPMDKLDDRGDSRIIPGGRILRKLCLDETPQFINVLRGEMSLVGPRPCIPYEAREYALWHRQRLDMTPGLTGLWQVSGKNRLTFKEMVRLDVQYQEHLSLWLDLIILLRTIPAIGAMVLEAAWKRAAGKRRPRGGRDGRDGSGKLSICQMLERLAGI